MSEEQQKISQPGISGYLIQHSKQLSTLLIAAIIIVALSAVWMHFKDKKLEGARSALFEAAQLLEKEELAVQDTQKKDIEKNKPAKKKAAPDEATPPPQFQELDVNATFPKTIEAYKKIITQYPGSLPAFQAQITLGNLYFDHKNLTIALEYFKAALKNAPSSLEKVSTYFLIANTQENSSQYQEAVQSIQEALGYKIDFLKGDLLIAQARCFEQLKDKEKAKSVYDKVLADLPNTPFAEAAEVYRAKL